VRPRFHITVPQFSPTFEPVLAAARFAEASSLDGVFLFDHLVPLGDPTRPVLELAATLGAVAAATSTITVGTLVMRVPLRGWEVSAALADTAATIAPGRMVVGLGAGDRMSADEAVRFGQFPGSVAERVAAVEQTVARLAGSDVRRWVGGTHERMLAATLEADGWNGWALAPERFAAIAGRLRAERPGLELSWGGSVVVGEDPSDLAAVMTERDGRGGDITGTADQVMAQLTALSDLGCQHFVVSVLPNRPERWEIFARSVVDRLG
jgi:alkanesulfonate monooxygenase SsuD/methylene tetrahydromethanopterin reductase-like flavin-dependent oxidoreductase (luciferase family)